MPTWHTGQAWRVVNALNKLNEQIRAYAPRAVPPATQVSAWGSIADDAHSTSSDHYPHFYSALGSTAVVCARDFPHAPGLGLDGHVVTEALRISRDARIGYLICDRRITGPNHGWLWQSYTGSDPHDTHFHVSSVHTSLADSTAAWTLPGPMATASTPKGHDMIRVMVQGGDGAVWLTGPTPLHIGPDLNNDLAAAGVPLVQVNDAATLNAVLGSQRITMPGAADPGLIAAAVIAGLPAGSVDGEAVLAALESERGQAALVKADNTAEDS